MKFKTVKSKVIFFLSILSLFGILFCIESCQNDLTFGKTTININLDLSKIIKTARNENSQNNTEFVLKLFVYDTQNYKNGAEIEKLPLVTQSVNKVDITGNVKVSLEVTIDSTVVLVAKLHTLIDKQESEKPLYAGNSEVFKVLPKDNKVHLVLKKSSTDIDVGIELEETFTITFNSLGGSSVESQSVVINSNVTSPEEPTKTGYDFLGWYTSTDDGATLDTEFDFESPITSDITLYAKWQYTVVTTIISLDTEGPYDIIGVGELTTTTISEIATVLKENTVAKINLDLSETTGVTSIEDSAFKECTGLTSIIIPESVTSIGYRAFYGCSNLTLITIPESVTSIDYGAFYGCSSLTSITLPESVTSIGSFAFDGCSNLTSITIPESVTSIGEYAFFGCSSLTTITIPGSVTSIGEGVFFGCSNLTSITISDGVTSIGEHVFAHCEKLENIIIPSSVTSINEGAFRVCDALTTVNYKGTEEQWNAIVIDSYGNESLTNAEIIYDYIGD